MEKVNKSTWYWIRVFLFWRDQKRELWSSLGLYINNSNTHTRTHKYIPTRLPIYRLRIGASEASRRCEAPGECEARDGEWLAGSSMPHPTLWKNIHFNFIFLQKYELLKCWIMVPIACVRSADNEHNIGGIPYLFSLYASHSKSPEILSVLHNALRNILYPSPPKNASISFLQRFHANGSVSMIHRTRTDRILSGWSTWNCVWTNWIFHIWHCSRKPVQPTRYLW